MKTKYSLAILSAVLFFTGCIKNDPVIFRDLVAEFDATSYNANSVGFSTSLTYPITGRNPGYGRVANTTDSTIRRFAQTLKLRVNLVGPQSSKDETVGYEVFSSPLVFFTMPATATCSPSNFPAICPVAFSQTPAASAASLGIMDAVLGTDYNLTSKGTLTIPANSSFGYLNVDILTTAPASGTGRFIGLRLNNSGSIKASLNYSELGLVIDKR
ncbi:MAG: hypothetical protein ABJA79_11335 [Parafilimonas sp.]